MQAKSVERFSIFGRTSISFLLGATLLLASTSVQARRHPVAIQCTTGCKLEVPYPDLATTDLLASEIDRRNPKRGRIWQVTGPDRILNGDTVLVCNGISCVEYTWRGGHFDSGKEVSNILPPPARGGGGGGGNGGNGGGGGPISGGCHGNCGRTGTVTVELQQM